MSNEIKTMLDILKDRFNLLSKDIDEENQFLKGMLKDTNDPNIRFLIILLMKENTRTAISFISLQQLGLLIRRIGNSISDKADKQLVKDLEDIRKDMESRFDKQDEKIEETLKPLSNEINKTLERQERNKDVYK